MQFIVIGRDGDDADAPERRARVRPKHLEFIRGVKSIEGKATAYVCENYVCQLPTTDLSTMKLQLTKPKTEPPPKKG